MFHAPKHLLINLVVIGGVVATTMMPVAYAENSEVTLTEPAHSLDMDATEYTKAYDVSFTEALRRLIIQLSSDDVEADLKNKYKDRLAGMYVEHTPNYRLVVRLKGNAGVLDTTFPLANKTPVPFAEPLDLPVVFQTGAEYTLAELEKIRDAHLKEFGAIPDLESVEIDERSGELVVDVFEPETASSSSLSRSASLFKNLPIKIRRKSARLGNHANARASESMTMTMTAAGTSLYGCTSGFNVTDKATQKKFFSTTAAHCGNYKITLDDRKTTGNDKIALNHVKDYWTADQDFQVMSVKPPLLQNILLPQFFAKDNVAKILTGKRTLAHTNAHTGTVTGDIVCHYGATTGHSCGEVQSVRNWRGIDCGPNEDIVCGRTSVSVAGDQLDCWVGDSGGPVFIGDVAVGLHVEGSRPGTWEIVKNAKPAKYYQEWNKTMKGKGGCGGKQKNGHEYGGMVYMSTDEIYKAGYQLIYGKKK
ncbi:hypothetical protein [Crenothrix polyspora]|uniref:Uncharacterized protein n=1 Tax=Crenothrix polyspora TaxID=360316 RepID=A0A1R4HGZ8_9GAMM|nr:hypothetical protein [Crenothrix polyspora]SJM95291.1 conserved hypothetical protein [Crenothrix polyspora]